MKGKNGLCVFLSVRPAEESVMDVWERDSVTAATLGLAEDVLDVVDIVAVAVSAVAVRSCGGGYFLKKCSSRGGSCCARRMCDSIAAAIVMMRIDTDEAGALDGEKWKSRK